MTVQEKFEEVKNHPLVLLLLRYYAKKTANPIPPVWQAFLKDSTESTSLDLMYTQLPEWDLHPNDVPPELRGQALLSHLLAVKFRPMLNTIQEEMTRRKLGFIPALEAIFRAQRIIPHGIASNNLDSKYNIRTNLKYRYVERGTLKYEIVRNVPARVLIPASFIRAFCGPEHNDADVWISFLDGLSTRFKSPQETQALNTSFEWTMSLLQQPYNSNISPNTGTRGILTATLPIKLNHCCSDAESSSPMKLSSPVPDRVDPSTIRFELPADHQGIPTDLGLDFPVLNDADLREYQTTTGGLTPLEPAQARFLQPLGRCISDPNHPHNLNMRRDFVATLRHAYEKITETEAFQTQRKIAIELAAGV